MSLRTGPRECISLLLLPADQIRQSPDLQHTALQVRAARAIHHEGREDHEDTHVGLRWQPFVHFVSFVVSGLSASKGQG